MPRVPTASTYIYTASVSLTSAEIRAALGPRFRVFAYDRMAFHPFVLFVCVCRLAERPAATDDGDRAAGLQLQVTSPSDVVARAAAPAAASDAPAFARSLCRGCD